MENPARRIAINFGGGYVPGLNSVVTGVVLAASQLGWEVVGIRDGFDGLLFPDRYPEGGLVTLTPTLVENLAGAGGCILGTAARSDPFHVRTINAENMVEEVDRSDELLGVIQKEKIDTVISVVGARALSILWKLSRKGLKTVCVPKSVENDVAATMLSFGFNSGLSFVADMLERCRQAAQSARRVGVVEVLGEHAGWLALQAGMAVCADAVLIPEIPYDLRKVALKLREKATAGRGFGLVVVAEGAKPLAGLGGAAKTLDAPMKAALSPGAAGGESFHVMDRSGQAAAEVALEIQRLTDQETTPLVLGQLAKGGTPTVVDRQLGLGYGAGAVRALEAGRSGVMVVFQPPDLKFVPMNEAINQVRTVPADSELIHIARALGISLGD
ncbi:MAG: 6-phosphofructokinase [Deltaproteobacteria bacterium]|nr:6-phosphofructokinase [Deltaproteobacteria bacterium]